MTLFKHTVCEEEVFRQQWPKKKRKIRLKLFFYTKDQQLLSNKKNRFYKNCRRHRFSKTILAPKEGNGGDERFHTITPSSDMPFHKFTQFTCYSNKRIPRSEKEDKYFSVFLSACLSFRVSIRPFIRLSVCLSDWPGFELATKKTVWDCRERGHKKCLLISSYINWIKQWSILSQFASLLQLINFFKLRFFFLSFFF